MFAFMYENGMIDKELSIIPECPICERQLVKTQDCYYTYYCNNCGRYFTRDLSCSKEKSTPHIRIFKRDNKK